MREAIYRQFYKFETATGFRRGLILFSVGAFMALGQSPFDIWPFTLIGLWLWSISFARAQDMRQVAKDSWWIGFGYFLTLLHWIVMPFLVEPDRDGWMAPFALVLLPAGLALFWAAGVSGAFRFMQRAPHLAWAMGLALGELARAHLFTGFPWGGFSHVLLDTRATPLFSQFGAEGLSILLLILVGIGALITDHYPRAIVVLLLPLAFIALPFDSKRTDVPEDAPKVRLVQPNAPQDQKWDPAYVELFYQRLLTYSAAPGDPDLIVWPETAIPYTLEYAGDLLAEISYAAGGRPVALGINRAEGNRFYNSLAVIGEGGSVEAIYDKVHLVPFGEYVPFGELFARFGIYGLAASQGGGYSEGQSIEPLEFAGIGSARVLICYEGIFPFEVSKGDRPDLLILVTNDAWFGSFAGPSQHFVQARIRAVETGLPMLRVANTGITALIDPSGEVIESLPLGVDGMLDVKVPEAAPLTLFVRFSGWPSFLLLAIGIFWIISPFGRKTIDRTPRDA